MSNFSFTIFGPEDGFKQFTVPNGRLIPDESFKINPSEFNFKTSGKLIQVIKTNASIYISFHQQVFQVNGDRPGYTFGESLFFETNNFDVSLIIKNLYELHGAFSHDCITDNGRFDGFKFVNFYKSTQSSKYIILREDLSSNSDARTNLTENKFFPNVINGFYSCASLNDLQEVSKIVSWMVESAGSSRYSRLLIIDEFSGQPSDEFKQINNLETENTYVLNYIYSKYKDIYQNYLNLEKINSELTLENNDLQLKLKNLNSKISIINSTNQNTSQERRISLNSSNIDLSKIESSIGILKSDIVKVGNYLVKIHDNELSNLKESSGSAKIYSITSSLLVSFLLILVGFVIFGLYSLNLKSTKTDELLQISIAEQNKNFKDLKNIFTKPELPIYDVGNPVTTPNNKTPPKNTKSNLPIDDVGNPVNAPNNKTPPKNKTTSN